MHLIVHRFSEKGGLVGEADLEVCRLFAFSVSAFQREKIGSDPSHSCYRYTGRSGVGVSTTSLFPGLVFCQPRELREIRWCPTCGVQQTNTGADPPNTVQDVQEGVTKILV